MKKSLVLLLLAACTTGGNNAAPQTSASSLATQASTPDEPSESAVLGHLGGYEWSADSPTLAALGPGTEAVLMRLASDATPRPSWVRVRALLGLRAFPTEPVKGFLVAFLTETHPAPQLRAGIDTLAAAFASSDPRTVVEVARSLRSHPEPSVQRAARAAETHARVRGALARP